MKKDKIVCFNSTRCPACGCKKSRVYKTKHYPELEEIRRLHRCKLCGKRFTSVEFLDD